MEIGVTIRVKAAKSNAYWKALVTGICRQVSTWRADLQMDFWGHEGWEGQGRERDSLMLWFILDLEHVVQIP